MGVTNLDALTLDSGLADTPTLAAADGAISVKSGLVIITKATAAALTLAAPTAGAISRGGDDGKQLYIISNTAAAHTVTQTTPGYNSAGTAGDVATFGAAIGNNLVLRAYNGAWLVESVIGATIA